MTTQAITASDIRDVQLYGRNEQRMPHDLCDPHYDHLCDAIAGDINDLVATPLFRNQFSEFLPTGDANTVDATIRINDRIITVKRMDGTREPKTVNLSTLTDDTHEAEGIIRNILRRANDIYFDCLDQDRRTQRNPVSLRGRASRYDDDDTRRERSPSPRRAPRGRTSRYDDDIYHSRRAHSTSPRRARHSDVPHRTRHDSDTSSDRVDTLEANLNLLRTQADRLRSEVPTNPQLAQDLTRLEEQIRNLERTLNITPTTTPSTEPHERLEAISNRLGAVEQAISNPTRTETLPNPTLSTPLTTAEAEQAQPTLSDAHFNTLMELSDTLSSQDLGGSANFPGNLKQTFDAIPLEIRNGIFYQTYLLCDPTNVPNPWPIGERLFNGSHSDTIQADNYCRAHAIRHFLLLNLACDFGAHRNNPPAHLIERFNRFSEEDKNLIYTQLQYILQRSGHEDNRAFAGHLFHTTATGNQRNNAMIRVLTNRIAEYHRYNNQARLAAITREFNDAIRRLQEENARLSSTTT